MSKAATASRLLMCNYTKEVEIPQFTSIIVVQNEQGMRHGDVGHNWTCVLTPDCDPNPERKITADRSI
jgi:hypothetical protein